MVGWRNPMARPRMVRDWTHYANADSLVCGSLDYERINETLAQSDANIKIGPPVNEQGELDLELMRLGGVGFYAINTESRSSCVRGSGIRLEDALDMMDRIFGNEEKRDEERTN